MDAVAEQACPSCGAARSGKFCAHCGEKRVDGHDFTVRHFVEESIEGFTHLDNKILRSLRLLLTRPGALTAHFEEGRKVRFMKPVQLFLICNVLFFLFSGKSNVFSLKLGSFLAGSSYREHLYAKVGAAADMTRINEVFLEKMSNQSKSFIFLFIPFYALYCALVFLKARKPFGLQLVFATHYFSFLLLFFALFNIVFSYPFYHFIGGSSRYYDGFATGVNFTAITVYFLLAARRYFKAPWLGATLSGIGAGSLFIALLVGYRALLFYNIVRTLH